MFYFFTRQPAECLRINDIIELQVLAVEENNVSLAIGVPEHIPVTWKERNDHMRRNNGNDKEYSVFLLDTPSDGDVEEASNDGT
ncbi:carbon storage regulator [Pseudomonas sp. B329]|uniref:carbon storage regulator n=1 Tax=Pseudomonas sp. B329 TaxID=1553459 RepID=UPI0020066C3C|nr:carbon storage regulator [Pseudomonas sp. B329]MCK3863838.1 carbon storage regulator [Pseudomonas sp. B329]